MIDWPQNQADEIIACARRWVKRLGERGVLQVPSPPSARNHKKRHSVNRERSREDRAKAVRERRIAGENAEARQARKAIVRAYYAGELPDLSTLKE